MTYFFLIKAKLGFLNFILLAKHVAAPPLPIPQPNQSSCVSFQLLLPRGLSPDQENSSNPVGWHCDKPMFSNISWVLSGTWRSFYLSPVISDFPNSSSKLPTCSVIASLKHKSLSSRHRQHRGPLLPLPLQPDPGEHPPSPSLPPAREELPSNPGSFHFWRTLNITSWGTFPGPTTAVTSPHTSVSLIHRPLLSSFCPLVCGFAHLVPHYHARHLHTHARTHTSLTVAASHSGCKLPRRASVCLRGIFSWSSSF